jgi:hypothetical protein
LVEGNGFDIVSVTDDYDGQTRSTLTPVDIGADAGNFTATSKTLNLTMLVEGFYDSGSDAMIQDTLVVYLRNSSSPYAIVDTAQTYLTSSGQGTFSFADAVNGVPITFSSSTETHLKHGAIVAEVLYQIHLHTVLQLPIQKHSAAI